MAGATVTLRSGKRDGTPAAAMIRFNVAPTALSFTQLTRPVMFDQILPAPWRIVALG